MTAHTTQKPHQSLLTLVCFNFSAPKINEAQASSQPQPQPPQPPLKPPKEIFIHIDLKGARPQLQFWINFCRLLRDWGGVHGLILEWEDSYPLEVLRMYHQEWAYSRQEAARMTTVAEDCGLKCIPLCQTFGHLEYVLKHFNHLREHPERPDCLVPIESFTDESFGIVTQLIDDVFNICPLAPAIHLGGDEVWHLGSGMRSQDRMERGETKGDLYLKHYSFVIDYVLRKYPGRY